MQTAFCYRVSLRGIAALLCLLCAVAAFAIPPVHAADQNLQGRDRSVNEADRDPGLAVLLAIQDRLTRVIADCERSVVSVIRIKDSPHARAENEFFRGPQGIVVVPGPGSPRFDPTDPHQIPNDFGSGVVIASDKRRSYILTAFHVVRNAAALYVRFQDGSAQEAMLYAGDPRSDLAVLRVARGGLKPIPMGDARSLRKGHIVLALGNPFATARDGRATASWGIVANLHRRLPPPETLMSEERTLHHYGTLIQTDCRLDIGTSGGALLNLRGQLVGIITALPALSDYDKPAGFAIPIDSITRPVIARLVQGREVEYGFLGITLQDVLAARRQAGPGHIPPGLKHGVVAQQVYPACPAYLAGLLPGDIIVSVDGEPVRNSEELILKIGTRFAGTRTRLGVIRGGERVEVVVKLGKYPVRGQVAQVPSREPWRGLVVDWVSTAIVGLTSRERLSQAADGAVVVKRVVDGSPAAQAGLRPGMFITHVEDRRVRDPDEFERLVRDRTGPVRLRLASGDELVVAPAGIE